MGQYHMVVNLTKNEYITPHKLGAGLKLWEQLANHPGTGAALIILLAALPTVRGGGDFDINENWHGPERTFPEHSTIPGPMPNGYEAVAARTIGRWVGDKIAIVGDYAERSDLPPRFHAESIYNRCLYNNKPLDPDLAEKYKNLPVFTDITDDVARVIEHELGGKFEGKGWKSWKPAPRGE
jgi:hypothetical protein